MEDGGKRKKGNKKIKLEKGKNEEKEKIGRKSSGSLFVIGPYDYKKKSSKNNEEFKKMKGMQMG